jgi:hypothetical protein
MSTVPLDGTEVLLKTNIGVVSAWWATPVITHDYFDGDDMEGCEWICYDDKFRIQVEWYSDAPNGEEFWHSSAGITGWMPIPQ